MTEFYVIMAKRQDGKVYADLHKTNQHIYLTKEDAEDVFNSSEHYKNYYHIVRLIATLENENGWEGRAEAEYLNISYPTGLVGDPQ